MTSVCARRVIVEGVVQGVGFRPFVHARAVRRGLRGWVRNTASGVEIEVEGPREALDGFVDDLRADPPSLARIERICQDETAPLGRRGFEIRDSFDGGGFQPVPPDVATCGECLREVMDPRDRRFGYPFTNCTHCGPRFTVIRAMPYDRSRTTMAGFAMCPRCREEYGDADDRRFHAEPNACPACGPRLSLVDAQGRAIPGDALDETRRLLARGRIVAIKGIGGFHVACDARSDAAARRLRERKGREAKPLALMASDLQEAERIAVVGDAERAALLGSARPIVLCREREGSGIAPTVAPGLGRLGIMLPYSPLHHLLFDPEGVCPRALILSSGNLSDEPMAIENADARRRLGGVADAFLEHDRPIHARADDSVVRIVDGAERPIRRSRGYAPLPVPLPFDAPPILGCGAELKVTICLTRGRYAFMSPHVGDLASFETYLSYVETTERMAALFRVRPETLAHDLHPGYASTRYAIAREPELARIAVQHHHAHVAACMTEHRLAGPVIGVAFDGTGYGTDGCVWGGEVLVADYQRFTRAAHLACVPMPGADLAIREPFRMALAHLAHAGVGWDPDLPAVAAATPEERRVIARQIETRLCAPLTSSVGRLFDAVASLIGVRQRARYEAQAAMEMEALAAPAEEGSYPFAISAGAPAAIDPAPLVARVVSDVRAGVAPPVIAAKVHATVAAMIVAACERARRETGLDRVVLSGGVFQNAILFTQARRGLARAGFTVFSHERVPPNDGGLALGQAVVAAARLAAGVRGEQARPDVPARDEERITCA